MDSTNRATAQPFEVLPREPLPPSLLPSVRSDLEALEELVDRLWSRISERELNLAQDPDRALLFAYGRALKAREALQRALHSLEVTVREQSPQGSVVVS